MTRPLMLLPIAALSAAVLLGACGGSTATTAPTGAVGTPAGATQAAAATSGPTLVAPTAPSGTAGPLGSFVIPSFAPDTDLAAKFPTTIDGQPVTDVKTFLYADLMKRGGQNDAAIQKLYDTLGAVGIDFGKMSFGSAKATVDGESVALAALRTPGTDANKVIQNYAVIAGAFGSTATALPTMTQANIGGKNVTVAIDENEKTTYLYVTGDTLFIVSDTTDSQTTKILQALP